MNTKMSIFLILLWVIGIICTTYTYNELKHNRRYLQLVEQSNRELSALVFEVRSELKQLKSSKGSKK